MKTKSPTKFYKIKVICGGYKETFLWHPQEVDSLRHFHFADGRKYSSDFAMMKNEAFTLAIHDGLTPKGALIEFKEEK